MELNKNPSHRSDSAARLLDTPSDLEEEMIPLSESDEHLSTAINLRIDASSSDTAINLRIDASSSSENDHSVLSSTRTMMPLNIPLNGGANGYGHSKTSPNVLWPGSGHGLNGQSPTTGQLQRPSTATSIIDLSEEIDPSEERPYIRSNETSQGILPRDTRLRIKPEIILAFLLAGLGNVAAGYMLAKVQKFLIYNFLN